VRFGLPQQFGRQTITTKVKMMVPKRAPVERVDVTAAMHQPLISQDIMDDLLMANLFFEEMV
jgi:hypothetical protein